MSVDGMGEPAQLQTDNIDKTPVVHYCCIQGLTGALGGTGNIGDDPLFVYAGGADGLLGTENDNLRLLPDSPCIDAGDNSAVPPSLLTDLDLEPRFTDDPDTPDTGNPPSADAIIDMGAYEGPDQGFLLSTRSVMVPEGQTATFTVALAIDPLGTVEVAVAVVSGDPDIAIHSGALLIFDSSNYSQPQRVTVAAAEDEDRLEDVAGIRISASDELFAGVIAWEIENDVAAVLFVDTNANGANDGTSWADAFNQLQDAIPLAAGAPRAVGEIRVAEGIYKPDHGGGVIPGDREAAFQLVSGVAICGGYAGFGAPDPNVRDIDAYKTILSGDLNGDDIEIADPEDLLDEPTRGENSYRVVTGSWTDPNAVLDGFTITAGNANEDFPSPRASGGGMFNHSGSPALANCRFIANAARIFGGGMFNDNSSPTMTNCTFSRNCAGYEGGGMYNDDSSSTLTNCTFSGNSAGDRGGGMCDWDRSSSTLTNCTFSGNSDHSSSTLTDCTFSGNSAMYGGGMYNSASGVGDGLTLTNCMFSANSAEHCGGGIYNGDSDLMLINCAFITNSGPYGGGMFNTGADPTLTNCMFTGNSAISGGGMFNNWSGPTLTNCTFTGNSTDSEGGGMYNYDNSSPTLTNCTFAANLALEGSALACDSYQQWIPSSLQVTNCILWDGGNEIWNNDNSTIIITYSDVQSNWPGEGNIDADPCFAGPGYWADKDDPDIVAGPNDPNAVWVEGDYHLLPDSPCINAGDPNYVPEPNETDLDGKPRVIAGQIDMGAYEYSPPVPSEVRIVPRTINLASKGKWITCYIWLGEGYDIAEIDPNSVLLEDEIQAQLLRLDAQQQAAIAKFSRSKFRDSHKNVGSPEFHEQRTTSNEVFDQVELTITGQLTDGTVFEATDVIRVIDKAGRKSPK
jgi:hypothetical protein